MRVANAHPELSKTGSKARGIHVSELARCSSQGMASSIEHLGPLPEGEHVGNAQRRKRSEPGHPVIQASVLGPGLEVIRNPGTKPNTDLHIAGVMKQVSKARHSLLIYARETL
jgi:hypothetical protein